MEKMFKRILAFTVVFVMMISLVTSFAAETNVMVLEQNAVTEKQEVDIKQEMDQFNHAVKKEKTGKLELRPDDSILEEVRLLNSEGNMQPGTVSLLNAEYTVSGTVSLPDGVANTGRADIGIYFYTPTLNEKNEVMEDGGKLVKSTRLTLNPGQTSINYSVSVPAGQYIIGARLLTGNANVISKINYYSAAGSQLIEHAGDVVKVNSNVSSKNITLTKAERSISGRIYVGQNTVESDVALTINASCFINGVEDNNNIYITLPSGQNYIDFEMGVQKNNYYLYVNNSDVGLSGYYNTKGAISNDYASRCMLDTTSISYSGINIDGSSIMSKTDRLEININFANAASSEKGYFIKAIDRTGNLIANKWVNLAAGERSLSSILSINKEKYPEVYVGYEDITDCNSVYWTTENTYFYMNGSITTKIEDATVVNTATTKTVTITEPSMYAVTGTVTRGNNVNGDLYVYVTAKFADGERYYTRQKIEKGKNSAVYTVYIPQMQINNEFELYCVAADNNDVKKETTNYYNEKLILSGNINNINLSLKISSEITTVNVSGRFSLPKAAPNGGLVVKFDSDDYRSEAKTYFIPAGQTYVDYTMAIPKDNSNAMRIRADITNAPEGVYYRTYCPINDNNYTNVDFTANKAVLITGRVSAPNGKPFNNSVTFEMWCSFKYGSDSMYAYDYFSILSGSSYTDYRLTVAENAIISNMRLEVTNDISDTLYTGSIYYNKNGNTTNYSEWNVKADADLIGINFDLMAAKTIKGTISIPENGYIRNGQLSGNIGIKGVTSGTTYSKYFSIVSGSVEYKLSIPNASNENYIIYVYMYSSDCITNVLTYTYYYYSNTGMTYDENRATQITFAEGSSMEIDLLLPVGKAITGTIRLPEGGYINGGVLRGRVSAESVVSGRYYDYDFEIGTNSVDYSISIPGNADEKYILSIYLYSTDYDTNILCNQYYYYTGSGMSFNRNDAKEISVSESGTAGINLLLPKGKTISGKIILPPDAYMEGNLTEIDFRCRNEDNYIIEYYTVALASDLSYSVVVSPEVKGNYIFYMINRNPLSTGKSNIINKTYYYNKDGAGSDYENASIITIGDSDVENINFTLETGKTISGTLCLPNGGYINNGKYEYKVIARDLERYEEYYTHLEISDSNVDYMIAVPKTSTADYILYIYCYRRMFNQEEDSNIYTNGTVYYSNTGIKYNSWDATKLSFENDQISGIQIVLSKVKAIIKGCVPRPIDYGYMGYMVCAEFIDGETYSANTYFGLSYENESKFAIQIPETESSNSFNIYYQIQYGSYGELDLPTSNVYINSNGSYTFDKSKASVYSLDNLSDIHFEFVENSEIDQAPPTVSIGDITDSLKIENGAVNGSVSANVSTSSAVNAKAIIAIYNRNKLVKVQQKVIKLYEGNNTVNFDNINVPVAADGEYYYKIFIWRSGTRISPLCEAKTNNIK